MGPFLLLSLLADLVPRASAQSLHWPTLSSEPDEQDEMVGDEDAFHPDAGDQVLARRQLQAPGGRIDFDEFAFRRRLADVFSVNPDEVILNISATVLLRDTEDPKGATQKASNLFNISVLSIGDITQSCDT